MPKNVNFRFLVGLAMKNVHCAVSILLEMCDVIWPGKAYFRDTPDLTNYSIQLDQWGFVFLNWLFPKNEKSLSLVNDDKQSLPHSHKAKERQCRQGGQGEDFLQTSSQIGIVPVWSWGQEEVQVPSKVIRSWSANDAQTMRGVLSREERHRKMWQLYSDWHSATNQRPRTFIFGQLEARTFIFGQLEARIVIFGQLEARMFIFGQLEARMFIFGQLEARIVIVSSCVKQLISWISLRYYFCLCLYCPNIL